MAIDTAQAKAVGNSNSVNDGSQRSILSDKATYLLKTGDARLARLVIQTVGTTWTITIYDALSAVAGKEIVQWVTADGKGPFTYQIPCGIGICVVSGGSTAGQATIVFE